MRLSELRTRLGTTQGTVAKRMGVSQPRIAVIESTPTDNLSNGVLKRYYKALGFSMELEDRESTRSFAERNQVDLIKDIASLRYPISYPDAYSIVKGGMTPPNRSADMVANAIYVSFTWKRMIRESVRLLNKDQANLYADMLGSPKIKKMPTGDKGFILSYLWKVDPTLASICLNHILINENIGVFDPVKSMPMPTTSNWGDVCKDALRTPENELTEHENSVLWRDMTLKEIFMEQMGSSKSE